ncbi:ATP-dependent endonuclease [Kitasatospora sp. NPDC048365]|uniref:ATP-dependent nuclease n=1 Tax=Kitasatospora sp. NPDC048365 TaxID=3364050 RepID=UPI00372460A5
MFIEKLVLENFKCFGPEPTSIRLDEGTTALIGANGSGKTAACEALLRLFAVTGQERTVRADDFHVPEGESAPPAERQLTIEAVLAFPELDQDDTPADSEPEAPADPSGPGTREAARSAVPDFFRRMAAVEDGRLKVRIVLTAQWTDDGTVEGAVTETRHIVSTFEQDYGDNYTLLTPAERSRIQMIYIPASRDGARQVTAFLRGRLWRAAQFSAGLRELASANATEVAAQFSGEPVVKAIEGALADRWRELHGAGQHAEPRMRLLDGDFNHLVRDSELVFSPDPSGRARPARLLSDGQRSLLHLALVAATLDVESAVYNGRHEDDFTLDTTRLPNLTLIAVEEPENSLSPFFLSRIVNQLHTISATAQAQALVSSHSASTLTRIHPEHIRYFRTDPDTATSAVREITLPDADSDAGKYVREAVHAHPELYFARFVILGEGDTEQLVIPRIAQARGIQLDPSFIAMVPLGGRHTNHMWRLLNDLDIPHATLLDLDYGKDGSGPARLRDACNRLAANGIDALAGIEGYGQPDEIHDDLEVAQIEVIVKHLRSFGVFYATPLDLDYAMLRNFKSAYIHLAAGARGPRAGTSADTIMLAVLGEDGGTRPDFWNTPDKVELLRWYRYLFLNDSKPGSHLQALSRLTDEELTQGEPEFLTALIDHVCDRAHL